MFSKITAFLHQAAEVTSQVLAPQLTKPEEFQGHWRAITECITSDNGPECTVQSTGIKQHLEQMADLLCQEEEDKDPRDPGAMGPCMEFLLRHKILDALHTTASTDYPTGMKREVLLFLTILLGRVERPLLPHVSVHQPVQKQVCSCGADGFSQLATDQVQFLRTLCLKLQRNPRLADFFLQDKDSEDKKIFTVAEALLRLVNSQDSLVIMKAYECLLTCVGLEHSVVSEALAGSQLPIQLASQLQQHFHLIPSSCHHTSVTGCHAGWGVDYTGRGSSHHHSTQGLWHIEAFFSWLDYCEQIVGSADQPLANAVCETIHELLLTATILPKLSESSTEGDLLLSTAVLTKCLQAVSCQRLLTEFVSFLLSDPLGKGSTKTVREKLIQHTDHLSDEVCHVTLQLFDVLVRVPLPSVVWELVLQYWEGSHLPLLLAPTEQLAAERQLLEEEIRSYMSLVPEHLSSCKAVMEDSGLEQYLTEAHQQVARCRALTCLWSSTPLSSRGENVPGAVDSEELVLRPGVASDLCGSSSETGHETRPCEATPSPTSPAVPCSPHSSSSSPLHSACEGLFLAAMLTKLERLLDQPYEVNLLLTSILSSLAAIPLPAMDHWLLSTQCSHHSRNVYSVLRKVSGELQSHAERSPGLLVNIVEARRRLTGMVTSDLLSMPHNDLLEGAIVLEEFSKELASILFAKKSTAMLTLPPSSVGSARP